MAGKYNADDLDVLVGLDPVRRRPGMFTDTSCPNHLLCELVDNSADEVLAGHADRIEVTLAADGSICVVDNGRGIPVDKHPEHKVSGVELIMTRLHAGGKFSNRNYRCSGGLHGVGVSVVNALASELQVDVWRGGRQYQMEFRHGEPQTPLRDVGSAGRRQTGTRVRFLPDPSFFTEIALDMGRLRQLLRAKAVLCPGLRVILCEEATDKTTEWFYEDGLTSYLADSQAGAELLPAAAIRMRRADAVEGMEWAMHWRVDGGPVLTESYVNLIPTPQGGSHVNGLRQGASEAVRQFCQARRLLPRGVRLTAEDVCRHSTWVLSVWMGEPQFSGQTKERLVSADVTAKVAASVRDGLSHYMHKHVEFGERIGLLAVAVATARQQSETAKNKPRSQGVILPGKLIDCVRNGPEGTELFLVEGDSAGGSARLARDRNTQAVLPLRGKILNTWEVAGNRVMESREIRDIVQAIGVSPGTDDLSGLRYDKICILADADSDGAHIASLLCALFFRHFRPLIAQGHVHVAQPPLYRVDIGKEVRYALDEDELSKIMDGLNGKKDKAEVIRFKGLGEMNADQLRETALSPARRRLLRLTIPDGVEAESMLDTLLARGRAEDRRAWLESKGDLAAY